EHALQSGAEIPPFYDSMIAKVIGHGASREEARARLILGLEQMAAFGVTTNQEFLMSCLRHPVFARGEATTAFIARHRDDLLAQRLRSSQDVALAALLICVTNPDTPAWRSGRSLGPGFPVPLRLEIADALHDAEVLRERDGSYLIETNGASHRF